MTNTLICAFAIFLFGVITDLAAGWAEESEGKAKEYFVSARRWSMVGTVVFLIAMVGRFI